MEVMKIKAVMNSEIIGTIFLSDNCDLLSFFADQKITEYGSYKSALTVNSEPLNVNSSSKNDSDERKMRAENDEKRRRHETQLHFVQKEHSLMLNKLHLEIENLQIKHISKSLKTIFSKSCA